MRGLVGLIATTWLFASCGRPPYSCTVDDQCLDRGTQGRCESQGFCSFPDTGCPSGSRFESNAGNELGGTCVPEGNTPDAPPEGFPTCGAANQVCCPDDTCLDNMFCEAGMCRQCVTEVGHGARHSCFIRYDQTLWCSGSNSQGQLGNGGTASIPISTPTQVRDTTNAVITDAIFVAAGENYSCAIRADKTVWCWGANDNCDDGGQLGDGSTNQSDVAVQVIKDIDGTPLTDVAEVYGAFCHTCARDNAGGIWCWGTNTNGRLGDGTTISKDAAVQVLDAPGGAPITTAATFSMGGGHGCFRNATDEVFCFGENFAGQIGDTTTTDRPNPVKLTGMTAISLAAGRFHTCAVQPDHTMLCWGRGRHARLGDGEADGGSGDGSDRPTPQPVVTKFGEAPFGNVDTVEMGAVSCALTGNGDPYCWGLNLYGQTGTGAGTNVPAQVLDANANPLHLVSRLVARFNRVCAFRLTGELMCWGRNTEGQLGDETFANHGLATPGAGPVCP